MEYDNQGVLTGSLSTININENQDSPDKESIVRQPFSESARRAMNEQHDSVRKTQEEDVADDTTLWSAPNAGLPSPLEEGQCSPSSVDTPSNPCTPGNQDEIMDDKTDKSETAKGGETRQSTPTKFPTGDKELDDETSTNVCINAVSHQRYTDEENNTDGNLWCVDSGARKSVCNH